MMGGKKPEKVSYKPTLFKEDPPVVKNETKPLGISNKY